MKDKFEDVFEVLGEGGGLKISRVTKKGEARFLYNHQEFDPTDEGLEIDIKDSYSNFEEPYELINEYSWHMLHVETLQKDYIGFILVKLIEKLNNEHSNYSDLAYEIENLESKLNIVLKVKNGIWEYQEIDNSAAAKWNKSAESLKNYQSFITEKQNKFSLTIVDLLYVSNFKGGNSTINDPVEKINKRLISYSEKLQEIEKDFGNSSLNSLDSTQIGQLKSKIKSVCDLTIKPSDTNIDGFSVSYLSALLHIYFPLLIPILDRRILKNLEITSEVDENKQHQIINIQEFYPALISKMYEISNQTGKTIREIDKKYFSLKIS